MSAFVLDRVPRIHGGPGSLTGLGRLARELAPEGRAALLVADPAMLTWGHADRAARALAEVGFETATFSSFTSDPSVDSVDRAATLAREIRAAVVVALGGGSAIDVGKAVAAVAAADRGAEHFQLCANPFPSTPLAKICVPTTSGTGSETTRTAVLVSSEHVKVWLWGAELKADLILLDPELVVTLPAALTAATGMDALVHAIEACTNGNAVAANDVFCHEAIRLVVRHLPEAVAKPDAMAARGAMQMAAALAGIGIDNAGTAVAHNIGHALASLRPIHHGRAVALAMLASLPWNIEEDDGRFARVASVMGAGETAASLPSAFERLLRAVGIGVSLAGEGHDDLTPEILARQMARPENAAMRRSNHRTVADEDLLVLARRLLTQT